MMEKSIPAMIMLAAGMTACIACIVFDKDLLFTLKTVLAVLVIFYVIGRIVLKFVSKINLDANAAAENLLQDQEKLKQGEIPLKEEARQDMREGQAD